HDFRGEPRPPAPPPHPRPGARPLVRRHRGTRRRGTGDRARRLTTDCFSPGPGVADAVMDFAALPERLAHVRAEIARRQAAAGWTHPVKILAVTKGFGPEAIAAALAAGLTELGENRVQEA